MVIAAGGPNPPACAEFHAIRWKSVRWNHTTVNAGCTGADNREICQFWQESADGMEVFLGLALSAGGSIYEPRKHYTVCIKASTWSE